MDKLEHLEVINLFQTPVSDIGFIHILEAPQLKRVYVWETHLTDAFIEQAMLEYNGIYIGTGNVFNKIAEPDSTNSESGVR